MATLDRWRTFLTAPKTLTFPRLELIGRDHAPSIVVGTGEVRMASPADFSFTLIGIPEDSDYVLAETRRQHQRPYDGLARFRLIGVDADGIEWAAGYTRPVIQTRNAIWTFTGEIDSLSTDDRSATVSREASTELGFLLRVGDPMAVAMARFAGIDPGEHSRRDYVMEVLGSSIRFAFESSASMLSITASHSPDLPATYCENWLGEPLRILFGQLIFPRLVARNFGDGRAAVWVRRSPGLIRGARWVALWEGNDPTADDTVFWSRYSDLLGLIAQARDKDGFPNFEAHKVTQLYEELIQAARGSRWVWALTFASSIEALAKMLVPKKAKPTQEKTEAIAALVDYINAGPGEAGLKGIAVSAVHRTAEITAVRVLRDLKASGVITKVQLSAWQKIRNEVMHGSLVSRYSNEEDDAQLLALAAMMHALTRELLRRSSLDRGNGPVQ